MVDWMSNLFIRVFMFGALSQFAIGLNNGMSLTPTMGFNTWESWGCNVREDDVRRAADALVEKGLLAAGYTYLNIDDCWMAKNRNSTGHLQPSTNFSSGMAAIGIYIHSKGLKYGIYESAGTMSCQQRAGTLGNEWIDAQTFASWGVDFLKYDDCFHELFKDPKRFPFDSPPILRYPLMAMALNKTGRRIDYMCNFPWQLWKMHGDDSMGGEWVGEFCNSWRTCGDPGPGFNNAMGYVDCAEKWADDIPSGPGRWNNLDAMEIGNGAMTEEEEQAIFSIYSLIKTPLYIGGDVTTLSGHSLKTYLNAEVIALNQDKLGIPGRRVRKAGDPSGLGELWVGALAGGEAAAILVNRGHNTVNVTCRWEDVPGFNNITTALVRDLWKHSDLGSFKHQFSSKVLSHSAVTVKLKPMDFFKKSSQQTFS